MRQSNHKGVLLEVRDFLKNDIFIESRNLAAKLDAFNVIDLKICETTMNNFGITRDEVPSFIESVPFAPDEIEKLSAEGYINL